MTRDDPDDGHGSYEPLNRRTVLRIGAGAIAAGITGCAAPGGRVIDKPTPAEPEDISGNWTPADLRLETPWTDDVDPRNPLPEYPRPQMTRSRWKSLNGLWEFAPARGLASPPAGSLSETILVPYPVESALSGIGRHEPRMWYRRTFSIPEDWTERVLLHLERVDWRARIYVNGIEVGGHAGGYDRVSVDITDALSEPGEQELLIGVSDPTDEGTQPLGKQRLDPGGIYYTACSGIWGSVWAEPVPESHIEGLDLTPDLDAETLRLSVDAGAATDAKVRATGFAGESRIGSVTGRPGDALELSIPDPRYWTPSDPFLYDLDVELLRDGERIDAVGSYFGMRSIGIETVDEVPRPTLNGEFVFQMGTLDQGYWPDGIYTAPTDQALKSDLIRHKELGFNTVRKHVKIEPARWYYWADRLGLLVWQDMPATAVRGEEPPADSRKQFERELHAMVTEQGNHPSVVGWVLFNEGWGAFDIERLTDLIEEWDPERLVDSQSGINVCRGADRICGDGNNGDVVDWHVYPGPDAPTPGEDRPAVLGEYGGMGLDIQGHLWDPGEAYSYASMADAEELTETYVEKIERIQRFATGCKGLSTAIYTQISDVETEINGLLTYDRQVLKPDAERLRDAHEELKRRAKRGRGRSSAESDLTPAAYWPFDKGKGTMAPDVVGDNDARLLDIVGEPPVWVDGRVGQALRFDGKHDQVAAPAVVSPALGFSVVAWVRLDSFEGTQTAVSQDAPEESAFALSYHGDEGTFRFEVGETRAVGGDGVETGTWYHLAGVLSGCDGGLGLHVNGQSVASATVEQSPSASDGNTIIGRGKANGIVTNHWDGTIDEVRLYNRPLTSSEIETLYAQTPSG